MEESPSLADQLPVPVQLIERRIYVIRGQKVMLDADLAELYRVPTKRLNEGVKRNIARFPGDFMFRLAEDEAENLRSQIATSSSGYGGRRYRPYAFTELGVAMLSSVLNSERAVQMNILIMRAFVKLRELLANNKEMAHKIDRLETAQKQQARTQAEQARIQQQHASILVSVVQDIQKIKNPPVTRAIGFIARSPGKK